MFCLVVSLAACQKESQPTSVPETKSAKPAKDRPVARIWISAEGVIELNGKTVSLDGLRKYVTDLKKQQGVVYYGRDAFEKDPHENAMKVIKLVAENSRPIQLSSKRDFSDVVGPNGVSREKPAP